MVIARQVNQVLSTMPPGCVFSISDFDVPNAKQQALVKALSRLVTSGQLHKVAKGRYYKPRETRFGTLRPSVVEIVKDLLEQGGQIVGYITGTTAFSQMGLTTQISSVITIGTRKYRRAIERGGHRITFVTQSNEITEENIPLLRLLDAIKMMREIPATSPDECIQVIISLIGALTPAERAKLLTLAMGYAPYVRATLGAILDILGDDTTALRSTLNGVTTYKLPITMQTLPTKSEWNII